LRKRFESTAFRLTPALPGIYLATWGARPIPTFQHAFSSSFPDPMRSATPLLTFVLLAVAGAPACAPNDFAEDPVTRLDAEGPLVSSLQVEVEHGSALLTLQVTNADDDSIEVEFTSGQKYDFVIERGGAEIWRWSADQMFTQALQTITFDPGHTETFRERWTPEPGTRGSFTARGQLTSSSHPLEQVTEFELH